MKNEKEIIDISTPKEISGLTPLNEEATIFTNIKKEIFVLELSNLSGEHYLKKMQEGEENINFSNWK